VAYEASLMRLYAAILVFLAFAFIASLAVVAWVTERLLLWLFCCGAAVALTVAIVWRKPPEDL
jgi:hypothetical protein